MSLGLEFQRSKVNRLIQQKGIEFTFKRYKKNEFGEPTDELPEEITVRGFYHETSSYVSKASGEATVSRTKPIPMILCTVEDGAKLKKNDVLLFKGKRYDLVDLTNVNELDICIDISLEVVQDG